MNKANNMDKSSFI